MGEEAARRCKIHPLACHVAHPPPRHARRPDETHAKLYYAALAMNAVDKLHQPLFDALQKEGKGMYEDAEIAAVVKAAGVDGDKFVATMKSFAVNSQVTCRRSSESLLSYPVPLSWSWPTTTKSPPAMPVARRKCWTWPISLIKKLQAAK